MAYVIATNIISPLGTTTEQNYRAVRNGQSAIKQWPAGTRGVPFDFAASLFHEPCDFVTLATSSAKEALQQTQVDRSSARTLYILSTTKGEIGTPPGETARKIAQRLGIQTEPLVVCNACISGVAAQLLAHRLISTGAYDTIVVTGCDVQSKFIIAGFNSLKALSPEPCRPFDEERLGLNLGEGAATMVFSAKGTDSDWQILDGAIRNDAYHISGPHPKGEGCYRALMAVLEHSGKDALATIGVHGTATMYNDQMESMAIQRAGLSNIPLSALKGYYGHTMGAAGVIETILTMRGLDDGIILPSKGFTEIGVSGRVTISSQAIPTDKRAFLKQLSGFGGCNGVVLYAKGDAITAPSATHNTPQGKDHPTPSAAQSALTCMATVALSQHDDLTAIYKERIGDYPKFYKMDLLSRLAFVATELLKQRAGLPETAADDCAVILFNRSSSAISDAHFNDTIADNEQFYPSPSVFVYTLPNITTGEIALRNAFHGETSFYILPQKDPRVMQQVLLATLQDAGTQHIISGWIDATQPDDYNIELNLYKRNI